MRWLGVVVCLWGCAGTRGAVKPAAEAKQVDGARYVDSEHGFEVVRPSAAWQLDATSRLSPEGIAMPVMLKNDENGAQVVIQIAPRAATPIEYAERLTSGLRQQPGFVSGDPEPLRLADGAVGFDFEMVDSVAGRVAIVDGREGVFMLMATWPKSSPGAAADVAFIFESVADSLRENARERGM